MSKTNRTEPNPRKAVKRNPRSIRIELDAREYEAIAERAKANFSRPTPYSKGVLLKHLDANVWTSSTAYQTLTSQNPGPLLTAFSRSLSWPRNNGAECLPMCLARLCFLESLWFYSLFQSRCLKGGFKRFSTGTGTSPDPKPNRDERRVNWTDARLNY